MSLVELYGEDLDKMARDRKANVWQKTSGEIKRALVNDIFLSLSLLDDY